MSGWSIVTYNPNYNSEVAPIHFNHNVESDHEPIVSIYSDEVKLEGMTSHRQRLS